MSTQDKMDKENGAYSWDIILLPEENHNIVDKMGGPGSYYVK